MIGKVLGSRYELIEKVGGGGMAYVYKAKCKLLHRPVAVKILRPEFVSNDEFVKRFRREAQAAASLSHPNIVGIYDVGQEEDIHYIVMEFIDGITLKDKIQLDGSLPPKETIEIAVQICEALTHAHQNQIIHRDIKPHNILLTNDGRIKVTDFGIARAVSSQTVTHTGSIMGSVQYFSPEQARGGFVGIKSDIYSLGTVLYEMVTGKVPFDGESPISIALKHVQNQPVPPKEINPKIPQSLNDIIMKALNKDENNRFENASILAADLKKSIHIPQGWYPKDTKEIEKTKKIQPLKNNTGGDNLTQEITEPSAEKAKKVKWIKLAIWFTILLLLGAGAWWGYTLVRDFLIVPEKVVPQIEGLTEDAARQLLKEQGLSAEVGERVHHPDIPAGIVITQSPREGDRIKVTNSVMLVVSKGPLLQEVPVVINRELRDARIRLRERNLEEGSLRYQPSETVPEGHVISQNPSAGIMVPEGTKVDLVISEGRELRELEMPDLTGYTLEEARASLQTMNLVLVSVTHEESTRYDRNQVISQSPGPQTKVREGTEVTLKVSQGPGPGQARERNIIITLPSSPQQQLVQVRVTDNLGEREVYNKAHSPEDSPITVPLTVRGSAKVDVYINQQFYDTKSF
jgi:serine/threonine-protein kinase